MPGTNASPFVIIDTDALIALLHEEDASFARAKETLEFLATQDAQIVYPITTIVETVTTLTRKLNKPLLAAKIVEQVKNDDLLIEEADSALLANALKVFQPTASKKRTIFDACVAATAKKLHTPYIFAFDTWYMQLGYTLATDLMKSSTRAA